MSRAKEHLLKKVSEWYDANEDTGDGDGAWNEGDQRSSLYRRLTIELHSVKYGETEDKDGDFGKRVVLRSEQFDHFLDFKETEK